MVKKKGKSKRTTLNNKYKVKRLVSETKRKQKKGVKRDAANGIVRPIHQTRRDPGIPNSWPFKQELLNEIKQARDKQQQVQTETREKRKGDLRALREHQETGGTARTIEELMQKATQDRQVFQVKQGDGVVEKEERVMTDNSVAAGQQSRRAYLRELKKVVDGSDVLLQVLDARDPIGSRIHPTMEEVILSKADKRMVLVLNKIDLVPKEVVGKWLTVLRRSHPTIAIKASSDRNETAQDATAANVPVGMEAVLQLLKNYARTGGTGGKSKTSIVVGVIGYPNTGKSSIINALKRSRAVGVSARPGFTTHMQEVVLDKNVSLLDCPGVVFDDKSALLGNCVDAESIEDPIPPVEALLKRCNQQSLIMTYNIPAFPPGDTMMFLAMVARSYGRVLKGGVPDKVGAARTILKDWNSGKIPYYTVPPEDAGEAQVHEGSAVIVTNFGDEFDISKFDSQIMNSLKDSDEMDFVELKDGNAAERGKEAQRMVKLLNQVDDEDMNDDEEASGSDDDMDEDEEDTGNGARAKLANAEDFNFDDM
jgi:nuclear GTP-binding protein